MDQGNVTSEISKLLILQRHKLWRKTTTSILRSRYRVTIRSRELTDARTVLMYVTGLFKVT